MTPERWRQITGVFHGALALDEVGRAAFLDHACAGDEALRAEVDGLLAAHRDAGPFGDIPVSVSAGALANQPGDACGSQSDVIEPELAEAARRRHPFIWVVWIVAVAAAMAFTYASWLLVVRGPSFRWLGWTEQHQGGAWYVAWIDPTGPAANRLKPGDRVVTFDGVPPAPRVGTAFLRRELFAGDRYRLVVERDAHRFEFQLAVAAGAASTPRPVVYFLISLVWCAVGVLIGFARPEQGLARLAFAAAVSTGLIYLSGASIQSGTLWQPLHVVFGYQFFCRFPTDRPPNGIWKWTVRVLYVTALPSAVLGLWLHATLSIDGAAAATRLLTRHAMLFTVFRGSASWITYCVAFSAMAAVTLRNYGQLKEADARRRVRWVAFGATFALVPQFYSAVVLAFSDWFGPLPLSSLGSMADVFDIAIPISVAYAVVRHRVFDITVVVRRGVQYLLARGALQAVTALPLVALIYTVLSNRHETIAELAARTTGYMYWIGAAVVVLTLRRPTRVWLDRRFFREEYDREQVLVALLDDLSKVESMAEMSRLIAVELNSVLHPKSVHVWHRRGDELRLTESSDLSMPPAQVLGNKRLLVWLEAQTSPVSLPLPAEAGLSRADRRRLAETGAHLIVPITDSSERMVGVLTLGEKHSEEPYSVAERRLLHAIAKQTAFLHENLQLRAQVSEEQRIRRDVLTRLDGQHLDVLKECPACGTCYGAAAETCERDGHRLTMSLPVMRTIDRRYRLDRLIGQGGMGAVYEAWDLRLRRIVALKIMLGRAFGRRSSLLRFEREARAAARLNHRNIVCVYDFGRLEGEGAYFVMERVQGITLRAHLDGNGVITPSAAADWFDQVLDGLTAAHAAGVVHRDLKPENVMGQSTDCPGLLVKILDFGLAKTSFSEEDLVTATGAAMGTSGYMAPEQIAGHPVDHRTDIFAVGVMVVEALTGERPFHGATCAEVSRAVLEGRCNLQSPMIRGDALAHVFKQCLARDPVCRYSSIPALRAALIPALRAC